MIYEVMFNSISSKIVVLANTTKHVSQGDKTGHIYLNKDIGYGKRQDV